MSRVFADTDAKAPQFALDVAVSRRKKIKIVYTVRRERILETRFIYSDLYFMLTYVFY